MTVGTDHSAPLAVGVEGPLEIDGLRIGGELGRGSRTVVLRAFRGHDAYALKVLTAAREDAAEAAVAFRREAAMLAAVDHPGLPRVHAVGEFRDRPYLVMDLVEGRSLAAALHDGPFTRDAAVGVARDIGAALAVLHANGLVHRDVKPANVIIRSDGSAQLIDFGLAGHAAERADGQVVGTLLYASPEQSGSFHRAVDSRSDLYSLGVVLFECLTGRPPFNAADVGELLRQHAVAAVPDPSEFGVEIDDALRGVLLRLLAKDPDDRYPDTPSALAELAALVAGAAPAGVGTERPLIGRDAELARLEQTWLAAQEGKGGACLVQGAPGSGKSRLARAVVDRARADGGVVLQAKANRGEPTPFGAIRVALDTYVREVAALPDAEREQAGQLLRDIAGEAAPVLASLGGPLAALLGVDAVDSGEGRSDQLAVAVTDFLVRLACRRGAALMHIDDVQWLDPATLHVLRRLAQELPTAPLLLVFTARDDDAAVDGLGAVVNALGTSARDVVTLGALHRDDLVALMRDCLPGLPSDHPLLSLLVTRSQGNPFVALQYLRAIVDAGLLRPSWGTWFLDRDGLDALELPDDTLGLVLARVQGLGKAAGDVLRVAAAVGGSFRSSIVSAVAADDEQTVAWALRHAADHQLIEVRSASEYGFVHDRIREALLDALSPTERAELHQAIALALDAEGDDREAVYATAHHFLLGVPGRTVEAAFAASVRAGRLALAEHAPAEAVRFLDAAVRLNASGADAALYRDLGLAHSRQRRPQEALDAFSRSLERAEGRFLRASILADIADVHRETWNITESEKAVHEGLRELGRPIPTHRLTLVLTCLVYLVRGLFISVTGVGRGTARGVAREELRLFGRLASIGGYIALIGLRTAKLTSWACLGIHALGRLGHDTSAEIAIGRCSLAFPPAALGLRRIAVSQLDQAEKIAREMGDPAIVATVAFYRAACSYMNGWDDGAQWQEVLETHGRWLDSGRYCDLLVSLGWAAAAAGRTQELDELNERAEHRRRLGLDGELNGMLTFPVFTPAVHGQHAEAAAAIVRQQKSLVGRPELGLNVNVLLAELHALQERNDHGVEFDNAVARVRTSQLNPVLAIRQHRVVYGHVAWGRLAQARKAMADPEQRPSRARDRQIRSAMRNFKISAIGNPAAQRSYALAGVERLLLQGKTKQAVTALARLPLSSEDLPYLAFEELRLRARIAQAQGLPHEVARYASYAALLGNQRGWPHRVRWIVQEFGGQASVEASLGKSAPGRAPLPMSGNATAVRELNRLHALEAIGAAASRVLDPDQLGRTALDELVRILAADRAFLFLVSSREGSEAEELTPYIGRSDGRDIPEFTGYSGSVVETVLATREPVVITGNELGESAEAASVVTHGLRSIIAAPLQIDGRMLGVVYLDSQVAKGIFTADDAVLLTAITTIVATSLETARAAQLELSVKLARKQRDVAETLRASQTRMSAAMTPQEVLASFLTIAGAALETSDVRLGRPDEGAPDSPTVLAVRLVSRNRVKAVLLATRAQAFDDADRQLAEALAVQAVAAYERATLFARVHELAVADDLTGIANRRRFTEIAERDVLAARRHRRPVAALMVDIDHFKRVNDTFGHPTGDDVIRTVAARINAELRSGDVVGRFGGEEFALLVDGGESAALIAERIRLVVGEEPIQTRTGPVAVTISVGIADLGEDDLNLQALIARADRALYAAKTAGRNTVMTDRIAIPEAGASLSARGAFIPQQLGPADAA